MPRIDLVGNWMTDNYEGISEERLELNSDGSGRLVYLGITDSYTEEFEWKVDDSLKRICFTPPIWEEASPQFEIRWQDGKASELRLEWEHKGDEQLGMLPQQIALLFYRLR